MVIVIFVYRAYHQYAWGYNFPNRTTSKKFRFRAVGHFSGLTPLFLAVLGHSPITIIGTLNFGPFSTKPFGTIRTIKKTLHTGTVCTSFGGFGSNACLLFAARLSLFGLQNCYISFCILQSHCYLFKIVSVLLFC